MIVVPTTITISKLHACVIAGDVRSALICEQRSCVIGFSLFLLLPLSLTTSALIFSRRAMRQRGQQRGHHQTRGCHMKAHAKASSGMVVQDCAPRDPPIAMLLEAFSQLKPPRQRLRFGKCCASGCKQISICGVHCWFRWNCMRRCCMR